MRSFLLRISIYFYSNITTWGPNIAVLSLIKLWYFACFLLQIPKIPGQKIIKYHSLMRRLLFFLSPLNQDFFWTLVGSCQSNRFERPEVSQVEELFLLSFGSSTCDRSTTMNSFLRINITTWWVAASFSFLVLIHQIVIFMKWLTQSFIG